MDRIKFCRRRRLIGKTLIFQKSMVSFTFIFHSIKFQPKAKRSLKSSFECSSKCCQATNGKLSRDAFISSIKISFFPITLIQYQRLPFFPQISPRSSNHSLSHDDEENENLTRIGFSHILDFIPNLFMHYAGGIIVISPLVSSSIHTFL